MFQRRSVNLRYTLQQTIHWLTWLAQQMTAHQQSELYLEQFQPYWLPKRQRNQYRWSFRLLCGLLLGLLLVLTGVLIVNPVLVLLFVLFFGLFGGLFGGTSAASKQIEPVEVISWSWRVPLTG